MNRFFSVTLRAALVAAAASILGFVATPARAQEAQWIWTGEQDAGPTDAGKSAYFRKSFTMKRPVEASVTIGADDAFELYVNGQFAAKAAGWEPLRKYDITKLLVRGRNTVALKVTNQQGNTAALAARLVVKDEGGTFVAHSTDRTWRTTLSPWPLWTLSTYNDSGWAEAKVFGPLGQTRPWHQPEPPVAATREPQPAAPSPQPGKAERFDNEQEFVVEKLLDHDQTGSLIAMTFNEFGQVIVSEENGPLSLIYDSDRDGRLDRIRPYGDKVTNCQGLLALNGDVLAIGDGPDGVALYRLRDADRDAHLEGVQTLLKFKGAISEYGPHGLVLGPDGMLYITVGGHTKLDGEYDEDSPHRDFYEGLLVTPRVEDPAGHAVGIRAPGGAILRTDIRGSRVELLAGGLRNAYDLAFNREGELFVHDSDMQADLGASWYRPCRVTQIVPGGEYGWRSGSAKWPASYFDSLPGIGDTPRGAPAGLVAYDHFGYPVRFHNTLFSCDWSEGKIYHVRLDPEGAGYRATAKPFIKGEPLNATDIEVGPDGSLYFVTGGRGTPGGLYRVAWRGVVPDEVQDLGEGIVRAIRQPQPSSAWGRQRIALIKREMGEQWGPQLQAVVTTAENPTTLRLRALDLMQWFGPAPNAALLTKLAQDAEPAVRAKTAGLIGLHGGKETRPLLEKMLEDRDARVRRLACEALLRVEHPVSFNQLSGLLKSPDRFEAWAARRLLERQPVDSWRSKALASEDHRLFVQSALALLIAAPNKQNARAALDSMRQRLKGLVNDRDFIDMLRLMQVAVLRGELAPSELTEFRAIVAAEFPAGDEAMNRELIRLLAYLQADSVGARYLSHLKAKISPEDRFHQLFHLSGLQVAWSSEQRVELLKLGDEAIATAEKSETAGLSTPFYLKTVLRDFARQLTLAERTAILADGDRQPHAALAVLYELPADAGQDTFENLKRIDTLLVGRDDPGSRALRVGILAVLARQGDDASMAYLRQVFDRYPERRQAVALGLAQEPSGDNWKYLVRSLPVVEDEVAAVVLKQIREVEFAPEEPEHYREVILAGLRLDDAGQAAAVDLLEYWTGERPLSANGKYEANLPTWQKWFHDNHPGLPAAELPRQNASEKWRFEEVAQYLSGEGGRKGSRSAGAVAFAKARCTTCHQHGTLGESAGVDLTQISRKLSQKQILEAIVFPAHRVAEGAEAKTIRLKSGDLITGIVLAGDENNAVLLTRDGERMEIQPSEIADVSDSPKSVMPSGLLEPLTLEEITDLFAYLRTPPGAALSSKPEEDETR